MLGDVTMYKPRTRAVRLESNNSIVVDWRQNDITSRRVLQFEAQLVWERSTLDLPGNSKIVSWQVDLEEAVSFGGSALLGRTQISLDEHPRSFLACP